jgi:diguanylate cyclase (GGDEF)-like protein/PAS domain S-box-containing protein
MADIVGRSIEEFIGVSAFDCIAPEALEDALAGFGRNFSSDTRLPITTRLLRPDGTEVAVRMAATPLRGDGDVIVGGLVLVTDLSAQRQTQEEITLREAWLDAILHDAFDLVVAISTEGLITFATPITFEILGLDEAQVIGSRPLSFVHHDDIEEAAGAFGHALSGSHLRDPFQCRIRRGDGIYVWFEFTATNLIENSAVAVILHGRNVTDRIEASEQLARKEAWLDAILHQAFDVVVAVTAEGMVTFATANIESFLLRSMDTFLGTNLLDAVDPDDRAVASAILATVMSEPGASESARFRVLRADGSSLWIEAKITNLLLDPAVEQIIINARDITERHLADTKIAYHAMHDALTGLPNRYLLGDRLHHAMARRGRLGSNLAVVFIDLDHFKVLNDSSGHAVGDSALCEVAARLRKVCRSGDTVARFGGDEFVLISENIASLHEGREVGERVLRAVTDAPFEASHGRVFLSVSVGVAVGDAEISVDRLLADADTAMYRAKTLGRSRVEVFDPSMRAAVPP